MHYNYFVQYNTRHGHILAPSNLCCLFITRTKHVSMYDAITSKACYTKLGCNRNGKDLCMLL